MSIIVLIISFFLPIIDLGLETEYSFKYNYSKLELLYELAIWDKVGTKLYKIFYKKGAL